jgi:hypothetical protein
VKEEEEIDMSVYDRLYKVEVYTGEAGINANVSKNILFLYLRSPEGEGGVYCFTSVHLSFHPSKIFFIAFFSATINGRNLIFGHKLHIGMPYCG